MKRLPVYVMTAAIAMTGASTMTAQAAVKTYLIGGNGKQCETSWTRPDWKPEKPIKPGKPCNPVKPNKPNGNGSCLPNINQPAAPDFDGSGLPDIGVPSEPDMNVPAIPDQGGNGLPDISVPNQPSEDSSEASFISQVVTLVNEERAKAGLAPLSVDGSVAAAADIRAKEIESSFSHTRPDGSSFSTALTQSGVNFKSAGENIAYGQRTPAEVMNGWMNSQGHRANILNKEFTAIGVGYHQNSQGTGYWTQLFTK